MLVLCLTWELLLGSQWVDWMAVLVINYSYVSRCTLFLKFPIEISRYIIAIKMHPFVAYIIAYSITITCTSFFTDITRKFHIEISKLIRKLRIWTYLLKKSLIKLQTNRNLCLLMWIILLSIFTVTIKTKKISNNT